ncbi:MAG: tRNA (adenosine(37)-N6)-threonylcarbamoyltransferase complex dimerization subunit type 1 TsaB [Alphaproteobacteria bacterium]|nr:tRNA (adenosine(37)-N6)-threonylcarbamoyltransferase complex dimerization subunit type 1 TsaB [Alphaproteobacteria bacterium]
MLILSIDSAGNGCAVCVWQDGRVLAEAQEHMARGQDQRLMPLIEEMMRSAGKDYANLDRIAVTRGPGSFTGLRIGLAAARGIGLASNKPVIGISRFGIYRAEFEGCANSQMIVIDSRRAELYAMTIDAAGQASEPLMWTQTEIMAYASTHPDIVITGDIGDTWAPGFHKPVLSEVAICAQLAASAPLQSDAYQPKPLYVRPPDVTVKTKPAA